MKLQIQEFIKKEKKTKQWTIESSDSDLSPCHEKKRKEKREKVWNYLRTINFLKLWWRPEGKERREIYSYPLMEHSNLGSEKSHPQ